MRLRATSETEATPPTTRVMAGAMAGETGECVPSALRNSEQSQHVIQGLSGQCWRAADS